MMILNQCERWCLRQIAQRTKTPPHPSLFFMAFVNDVWNSALNTEFRSSNKQQQNWELNKKTANNFISLIFCSKKWKIHSMCISNYSSNIDMKKVDSLIIVQFIFNKFVRPPPNYVVNRWNIYSVNHTYLRR